VRKKDIKKKQVNKGIKYVLKIISLILPTHLLYLAMLNCFTNGWAGGEREAR
jgi:hypothetical protein